MSECILAEGEKGVECVKVDGKERGNQRGKMDINGYELAWPTIFFLPVKTN